MRIAIIGDDSLPKSTLVHAKMLHELAVEFKCQGHQPILIAPGSPSQNENLEKSVVKCIDYWKFKSGKLRGQGKLNRAINETLMPFRAWKAIKPQLTEFKFDLIIYYSPSIFFGPLVKKLKKHCHAKSYLVLRDMFPQWAVDEGLIQKGSLIEKYFRYFESINYRSADKIGLMSPKNKEIFDKAAGSKYNTEVLFNWADLAEVELAPFGLRKNLNLEDKVIYFYGGNIGHAQDMSNLLRLAKSMKSNYKAHFILLGQGDEVDLVKEKIQEWQLANTTFLPSVTQDEYKAILKEVDVGLFSLAASHKSHNFPGKLLGYMHSSLPILGSVNEGNDLIDIVSDNNAGYIFVNGDDKSFYNAAVEICNTEALRCEKGKLGNMLLAKYFSVGSTVEQLLKS